MMVWAVGLLVWESIQERRAIEQGMQSTVRALMDTIDQDFRLSIETLETISLSRLLAEGDYEGFHKRARQLVVRHPQWVNLTVIGHSGQMLVNSLLPYGQPLPWLTDPGYEVPRQALLKVLETDKPAVSDVFLGPISGRHMVALAVPVSGFDGQTTHVLMAGIAADQLAEGLKRFHASPDWVVGLLDGDQTMVARTIDHDRLVGKPALAWFQERSRGTSEGVITGQAMHGPKFTFAYQKSELTGWTLVFGAPHDIFFASLGRTAALTGGVGLATLALSLALALWVASRILRPVQALNQVAAPFIDPAKPPSRLYPVRELDDLHRALDGLSEALATSESRFRRLFATAPVMLDVTDAEGRLVEVNDTWLRTLGYSRDHVLGHRPAEFQTPQSRAYMEAVVLPELMRRGGIDDVALQFVTRWGDVRDVMLSSRVERLPDGGLRSIAALRDVTDQRRIERALANAIEEAERANDAKSRFLA
ncbi:MAG TPA: PAS domain S-box protein, partial [Candidatus Omnitrophota bacterium]|nr:PAS domain S-box protein [Candidatus Omnitrophota bacterium]